MTNISDGYSFFEKNTGSYTAAVMGDNYVGAVNDSIQTLIDDLNSFKGYKTDPGALKGDIAEFWHSDTFNINAILRASSNRTDVDRSHDFASPDISSNFGSVIGLKYYKDGIESAKQQAKSIEERFREYQANGGIDSKEEFLAKRGLDDPDQLLSAPIYGGQVRIIPTEQLKEAEEFLRKKYLKELKNRPDQAARYKETLDMLSDRIKDGEGTESIVLSKADAEKLAILAKEGGVSEETLKALGISTEDLIGFDYIIQQSFKAGLTSATISLVLKVAPEIYKAIYQLVSDGVVDSEHFKKVGFDAIDGGSEGFIRGSVSAAITTACKAGLWGESLKNIEPSVVGAVTVIVMDTIKNSFKVAVGKMERVELVNELTKEMYVSACSLIAGGLTQSVIEIPVFGFMLGSFVGSMFGSITYDIGYGMAMSFCVDSGFTMFGLVKQDYTLPIEVMKQIGLDVFEYEKFEPDIFKPDLFEPDMFVPDTFKPDTFVTEDGVDFTYLRRGVIGINTIGYL